MPQGRGCPQAGWPRNRGPQSLWTFHQSLVGRGAASSQAGGVSLAKTWTVADGTPGCQGCTATLLQSQVGLLILPTGLPHWAGSVGRTEGLLLGRRVGGRLTGRQEQHPHQGRFPLELCELTPRHRSRAGQEVKRWAQSTGVNDVSRSEATQSPLLAVPPAASWPPGRLIPWLPSSDSVLRTPTYS